MSADARALPRTWLGWASVVAFVAAAATWACTRPNPAYCEDNSTCPPGMGCNLARNECVPDGLDGGRCDPGGCPTELPMCNVGTGQCESCDPGGDVCDSLYPDAPICFEGACVQCEESSDCSAEAPACVQNQCEACESGAAGDAVCADRGDGAPYCLQGACVACRGNDDCGGDTPVCEQAVGECRACESGTDCKSGVCDVFAGACAAPDEIIIVDASHANAADLEGCGSEGSPCESISGENGALAQVESSPGYILVRWAETLYSENLDISEDDLIIVGDPQDDPPIISPGRDEPLVASRASASVRLEGLILSGTGAFEQSGIVCDDATMFLEAINIKGFSGHGISASACRIDLHRSWIEGNEGGGIDLVDSVFDIVNNVVVENGEAGTSELGGARVSSTSSQLQESRFAFNTVADNEATDGAAYGVQCGAEGLRATSNIVYYGQGVSAVNEGCDWAWAHSNVEGGIAFGGDDGNTNEDPSFQDEGSGAYQLSSESPCVDAGEPVAGVDDDITGEARGEAPDCGAYEYR